MTAKTAQLRSLINSGERFIAADAVTVLMARLAERTGFPALYVGGHALGSFHYGIPDLGALEPHEVIEQTGRIARSVSIPVVVDADELGGNVASIHRNIRDYESAGLSGIHMEDEHEPKHSSYQPALLTPEDMQGRIAAAVAAKTDPDFVIIARTNELIHRTSLYATRGSFGEGTIAAVIKRGQAYAEAGADAYLPTGLEADEVDEVARAVPIPLAAYSQLGDVKVILSTGWAVHNAVHVYEKWARVLLEAGTLPAEAHKSCDGFLSLLGQEQYDEAIFQWASRAGLPAVEMTEQ